MIPLPEANEDWGDTLPCSTLLHRGARKSTWLNPDEDQFLPVAFELRPYENDLSVDRVALRSQEEAKTGLDPCHGLATLHTGRIRDLGLDVIPDALADNPAHAKIIGLPSQEEDLAQAQFFATQLARQSRVVWRRKPRQT